jgi:hypothetical protein
MSLTTDDTDITDPNFTTKKTEDMKMKSATDLHGFTEMRETLWSAALLCRF